MIGIEELQEYISAANTFFEFMNGKINTMNPCTFRIEMYDYNGRAYANINYPNDVYINIGTIAESWNDEWIQIMSKRDYIFTIIAWSIAHELFHADQLISMVAYNHDPTYRLKVEGDVQRASYDWVYKNRKKLSELGNFNCKIAFISSEILPPVSDYRKASAKEFYFQTIANIILRDLELFNQLTILKNDNDTDSILVVFNKQDSIMIKEKGMYKDDRIKQFSDLAYKYAGQYVRYSVSIATQLYNNKSCIVDITITDQLVEMMRFKKEDKVD